MNDAKAKILNGLDTSLLSLRTGVQTPAQAFFAAANLGQAEPFLSESEREEARFPVELRALALGHLATLGKGALQNASALAAHWQTAGIDDIETLSARSESLFKTIHEMSCAWSIFSRDASSTDDGPEPVYQDAYSVLEALADRLSAPDAKPILAAAHESLAEVRALYSENDEVALWWYLSPNGPVGRAYEETQKEAASATDFFRGFATANRQTSMPVPVMNLTWGRKFQLPIAAADANRGNRPSPELQKAFERLPSPGESDVRQDIPGEGAHLFARRLDADWRILVDVVRCDGQPIHVDEVTFENTPFVKAGNTRWILDLRKSHPNISDYRTLLQTLAVTFVFNSGTRVTLK